MERVEDKNQRTTAKHLNVLESLTSLVQTAREDVDDVSISSSPVSQCFVMFQGFLHILGVVLFDVIVRANGKFEFVTDHHSGALCAGAPDEQHDTTTGVWETSFQ